MNGYKHLYPWQMLSRAANLQLACRINPKVELDLNAARKEVARIVKAYAPAIHHSGHHHDGGWRAISLIGHRGNPLETRLRFPLQKTPAMALAPTLERFVDALPGEKRRVRLMELQPGKSILWHFDKGETIDDGGESVRLHVPIFTNPEVRFQISHQDLCWREGELWYGDFSFPHRLYNAGSESRVHLVIDITRTDLVLGQFPKELLSARSVRMLVKPACQQLTRAYWLAQQPLPEILRRLSRKGGERAIAVGRRLILK